MADELLIILLPAPPWQRRFTDPRSSRQGGPRRWVELAECEQRCYCATFRRGAMRISERHLHAPPSWWGRCHLCRFWKPHVHVAVDWPTVTSMVHFSPCLPPVLPRYLSTSAKEILGSFLPCSLLPRCFADTINHSGNAFCRSVDLSFLLPAVRTTVTVCATRYYSSCSQVEFYSFRPTTLSRNTYLTLGQIGITWVLFYTWNLKNMDHRAIVLETHQTPLTPQTRSLTFHTISARCKRGWVYLWKRALSYLTGLLSLSSSVTRGNWFSTHLVNQAFIFASRADFIEI